jgi:hypothetical protein
MNFLTIDYTEFETNSYKSLQLSTKSEYIKFDTCNPIVDYYEYIKFRIDAMPEEYVTHSSTVDHFISDCNYTWRYIEPETGKFYSDEEIESWFNTDKFENFDKCLSVICSNRIKTRKGYEDHIRNHYKLHPNCPPKITKK